MTIHEHTCQRPTTTASRAGATRGWRAGSVALATAVGLVITAVPASAETSVVTFADENLEACVARTLEIDGPISPRHMEQLTELYCTSSEISALDGLQVATNLTSVDLSSNQITDLTPLAPLTSITNLIVMRNPISDLSPLANLTDLETLFLAENQISDLAPLASLTKIDRLSLNHNSVVDLTPLAELTSLTWLGVEGNDIVDLAPLARLTNVDYLFLGDNQISDITPLSDLTTLKGVYLTGNQIVDLTGLDTMVGLTDLRLEANGISDLTPLSALSNLRVLHLSGNTISSIAPLAHLGALEYLMADDNQILDVAPLSQSLSLVELNLNSNKIMDVSALAQVAEVAIIDVTGQQVPGGSVTAGTPATLPGVIGFDGSRIDLEVASASAIISDDTITWSTSGTGALRWNSGNGFQGSVNYTVAAARIRTTIDPAASQLPGGLAWEDYVGRIAVAGSPTPRLHLTDGALPAGIVLTSEGELLGTPSRLGTSTFTVTADNGVDPPVSETFSIKITAVPQSSELRDVTGDGIPDLLGVNATGALFLWPGSNDGTLGEGRQIGSGWANMGNLTLADNLTSPGSRDLVATNMRTGSLWAFPIAEGRFRPPVRIGSSGWTRMNAAVGISGFVGPDSAGLIVRDGSNGTLHYYNINGTGTLSYRSQIGSSWGSIADFTNVGDWNGDGNTDIVAMNQTGQLWVFVADGSGRFAGGQRIDIEWSPTTNLAPGGDWNGDGRADLLTINPAGQLWLYPAAMTPGFDSPTRLGVAWANIVLIS